MAIAHYRNHPCINAISEKMGKLVNTNLSFDFSSCNETVKGVNKLIAWFLKTQISSKYCQDKYRYWFLISVS